VGLSSKYKKYGQPFGGFFGTLRPQMKTRGYLKPTKTKNRPNFSFLPEKIKLNLLAAFLGL
jgi:hypothetical protein